VCGTDCQGRLVHPHRRGEAACFSGCGVPNVSALSLHVLCAVDGVCEVDSIMQCSLDWTPQRSLRAAQATSLTFLLNLCSNIDSFLRMAQFVKRRPHAGAAEEAPTFHD
jgi:hypothetical protein